LVGPSAIAFITGDPVEAAKSLRDFAKDNPLLVIKGGVLDGAPLTADEIKKLANLESREVLLAKLAGAMKASMQNAASLFAAPLSQAVRTIDALRAKVEADPSNSAPAAAPAPAEVDEPTESAEPVEAVAEAEEVVSSPESSEAEAPAEAAETAEETPQG
jgi:large subunit ribosomal protein L10